MSRIVIWSPNYAPELIGISPIVADAASWMADHGHDVSVVTAMPNYPERRISAEYRGRVWCSELRGGVQVFRSWLRVKPGEGVYAKALYEFTFALFSLPRVIKSARRADVIVCVVPSLVAAVLSGVLLRLYGRRRPRFVLWVQDIVSTAALSVDGGRGCMSRSATLLESLAGRSADSLVVCSPGFERHFVSLGVESSRVRTVLNSVDTQWILPSTPRRENGVTRFLYAGNLGYTQGWETLLAAARMATGIAIDIVGDGNAATYIASRLGEHANVTLRAPVPREQFPGLLATADALIVLQRAVSAGANFPSKIATYLASGRPIVAAIDPTIPAANTLRASGAAVLVSPENPAELAAAMASLAIDPAWRAELGVKGRAFAQEVFDRNSILPLLTAEFLGVAPEPSAGEA